MFSSLIYDISYVNYITANNMCNYEKCAFEIIYFHHDISNYL